MPQPAPQWQVRSSAHPPAWLVQSIRRDASNLVGTYAAQLLWQRGIQAADQIAGFLDPSKYQPASPFEFGQEMQWAVDRLLQAQQNHEIVGIWGDFDADGVTATSVLWDGLGRFFTQNQQLYYYIPNRLTESHGLSQQGLDWLKQKGCQLIVTCDTGSTNFAEIDYAHRSGMDVIVTDHHTLPIDRPAVAAIINPRYLTAEHPLANLSGVAVAYKLVEALYQVAPNPPQAPLEQLLDLVAIGLIADLVELKGDCRYLAQLGINQLQKQSSPATQTRPGIARLLELCKRSGDRPTDISFGLGPRINAVSRIQGDAHFCVELLTSQDVDRCRALADATELANARRKALQKEVYEQVTAKLKHLDLSTTRVIVLADEQWAVGVLGLVAGQVAQEYGRPTILLSTDPGRDEGGGMKDEIRKDEGEEIKDGFLDNSSPPPPSSPLARGSARSINQIDLYQLVKDQAHLLHRFGGHPFAAGLSLPIENIPLFTESINQRLQQIAPENVAPVLEADLVVTVAELGKDLFRELKLLEPCGMGNPVPRLLIQNCRFEATWHQNIKDWRGRKIQYIQTTFELWDNSTQAGFPGVWWGHYKHEIPTGQCDAIVELDFNAYKKRYEVRLIAVKPHAIQSLQPMPQVDWILDWRSSSCDSSIAASENVLLVRQCPSSWSELQVWFRRAVQERRQLAIAYPTPSSTPPEDIWQKLVGIAKYLSRTGKTVSRTQLGDKLEISDRLLKLGFQSLTHSGFQVNYAASTFQITWQPESITKVTDGQLAEAIEQFCDAIQEERFRQQYFYQLPLAMIQSVARQTINL
jgi:single-stranded-DNA-specific exonuclease